MNLKSVNGLTENSSEMAATNAPKKWIQKCDDPFYNVLRLQRRTKMVINFGIIEWLQTTFRLISFIRLAKKLCTLVTDLYFIIEKRFIKIVGVIRKSFFLRIV